MLDFNDAEPQMGPMGELLPDGEFVKLKLVIRPGGVDGPEPADKGLLRASKTSDAKMLDCEFVVVEGPYARKRLWQNFTVAGGKLNDKGVSKGWNISKSTFRAMIESAIGLSPKDMSEEAKKKRALQSLSQLNGITFAARTMIELATDYPGSRDKNVIANVITRGEDQYEAVMRGERVQPEPVNAKPRRQASTTQASPSWAGGETSGAYAPSSAPSADTPAWLS